MKLSILYRIYLTILFSCLMQHSAFGQAANDTTVTPDTAYTADKYNPSINAFPYAFYTPETQVAVGAGGVFTFYTKKDSLLNPSKVTFSGFYSSIKTYELFLVSNIYR